MAHKGTDIERSVSMGLNAIIGQSGGPTSVMNASLAGVLQACQRRGAERIYGMRYGVRGLLEGHYVDLSESCGSAMEIELLKRTPSSYLGSCRYRMPSFEENPQAYEKLFRLLERLNIGYFFYIGGNDSMDTIMKLSDYARVVNSGIRFMGVPQTIDNSLMGTDHTPGYGSAAKYVGTVIKELCRDASVYGEKNVTIVEIMGRNAGWLTAAAALARGEDCEGADLICLSEVPFYMDRFMTKVEALQKDHPSVVVAVSEGIRAADGRYVAELAAGDLAMDAFGRRSLSGTARYLCSCVERSLNTKTRAVELSTLQRCAAHISSRTDVTEAYQVGGAAAMAAFDGKTGMMASLRRLSNDPYQCVTELVDVHQSANFEKKVPLEWVNNYRTGMTQEFISYARPLIQDELTSVYIDGLPRHIAPLV